jgi:hypothetical protein
MLAVVLHVPNTTNSPAIIYIYIYILLSQCCDGTVQFAQQYDRGYTSTCSERSARSEDVVTNEDDDDRIVVLDSDCLKEEDGQDQIS